MSRVLTHAYLIWNLLAGVWRVMFGKWYKIVGTVLQVYSDIPAWPGRNLLDGSEHRCYFSLKTSTGDMEFECRNKEDHQVWTEGISHLLYISSQARRRWTPVDFLQESKLVRLIEARMNPHAVSVNLETREVVSLVVVPCSCLVSLHWGLCFSPLLVGGAWKEANS